MGEVFIMRISFLVVSYHTVNFFRPIIKELINRGNEVQICAIHALPFGAKEDGFNTHRVDWHLFEFKPLYDFKPDKVVVFNGYFKPIHAACQFLKSKYDFLHAEVAWFPQRDYIYIDRDIHDRSDVAKRVANDVSDFTVYKEKCHILEGVRQNYIPCTNPPPEIKPDKINIVVPLQLESDTSILYASPYFKDMESLVGFIDKCARRYGSKVNIIVKKHPKWAKGNFDDIFTNERYPHCNFVTGDRHTMNDYAYHCQGAMGINSTSLMEAVLHRTPVLQMGGNVYCRYSRFPTYTEFEKFLYDLVHEGLSEEYFIETEMALLTLLANQVSFRHPESWVIDKLEGKLPIDYTRGAGDL
jgi:hypothetical protein